MKSTQEELENIIQKHIYDLKKINEDTFSIKPSPSKWSKKEMLGHLIDSAQNNIRRFIMAQYEENPEIRYNPDNWVAINNYQHWNTTDMIDLWFMLNKQICHILNNTPISHFQKTCQTENLHSIEWLATDYNKHLRHHLNEILDLDPVPYP